MPQKLYALSKVESKVVETSQSIAVLRVEEHGLVLRQCSQGRAGCPLLLRTSLGAAVGAMLLRLFCPSRELHSSVCQSGLQ